MNEQRICIVAPSKGVYSETFIRAHIDRLPMKVTALYGYPLPEETGEGIQLYTNGLVHRILNIIGVKLFGYQKGWHQQRAFIHYLERSGAMAVLAEYGHTGVAMMDVCSEAEIPLIVHFHGHDAYHKKILECEGRKYPKLFRKAEALIVVSKDMYQQLIKLGAPREKIIVNSCGVEITQFDGADPANADPVFISVGRFVDKKAPHLTILAFNQVLKPNPGARLIMIGDGPLLESCYQLASALEITHAIQFLGARAHDQVAEQLRLARAFVQHSVKTGYGDSEGTPVAILEASAAGLPVVATRHAGIQDVIIDGETGFLVDERDIQAMSKAMEKLVQNPSLAAQLGRSGRVRVAENYSLSHSIKGLHTIISNAIENWN